MNATPAQHNRAARWRYFFPLRLLLLHLKKNHFLLAIWLLLLAIVLGLVAKSIGVPQQFLVPEYRGGIGIISFGILGFSFGGFITGYNLYTYIMHGFRFPFIATLSHPFQKFSLNNLIIPAVFVLTYCISSAHFQITKEFISPGKVVLNLFSFLVGISLFQALSYFYFLYTNKEAVAYGKAKRRKKTDEEENIVVGSPIHHKFRWLRGRHSASAWHVETYIYSFNKINLARESQHYSKEVLNQVFAQNHINASRFEVLLVISFLLIGSLRSFQFFVIPAAASCMLFFTMLLMIVSAVHSWLRGWTLTVFILFLLGLNYFYSDFSFMRIESRALGLNYEGPYAPYDLQTLKPTDQMVQADIEAGLQMLNNRLIFMQGSDSAGGKPKLVILNSSGGGSRSAFWTMRSLSYVDSVCNGKLMNNCALMTGASGGMLGAAYSRELYLRKLWGEPLNPYDSVYAENMAMDLLNPIILSAATNDWFIRYQKIRDGEYTYSKDRATEFEQQLQHNTNGIFNRRLGDYKEAEMQGHTPMMVLSPTIVNDGRRMVIASQPVSYLTQAYRMNNEYNPLPEDVEFSRMFAHQNANNLHFITALRMNATFPYVLPMTTLPSIPPVEVLDAGIRDNFGLKTTLQFIYTFRDWIKENTSGVVIVQLRDLPKNINFSEENHSLFGNFSAPIGGIYGNITKTHDYNSEQALRYLEPLFQQPIDVVTFQLYQEKQSHISLSWHLTNSEKKQIREATRDPLFQKELKRLKQLLH